MGDSTRSGTKRGSTTAPTESENQSLFRTRPFAVESGGSDGSDEAENAAAPMQSDLFARDTANFINIPLYPTDEVEPEGAAQPQVGEDFGFAEESSHAAEAIRGSESFQPAYSPEYSEPLSENVLNAPQVETSSSETAVESNQISESVIEPEPGFNQNLNQQNSNRNLDFGTDEEVLQQSLPINSEFSDFSTNEEAYQRSPSTNSDDLQTVVSHTFGTDEAALLQPSNAALSQVDAQEIAVSDNLDIADSEINEITSSVSQPDLNANPGEVTTAIGLEADKTTGEVVPQDHLNASQSPDADVTVEQTAVETESATTDIEGEALAPEESVSTEDETSAEVASPSAELVQWQAGVAQATENICEPDLIAVENAPQQLQGQGQALNAERRSRQPNYTEEAQANLPPTPDVENPPPPPEPDPVPEATNLIQAAAHGRLLDQTLPSLQRSPGHPQLNGGQGRLPSTTGGSVTPSTESTEAPEMSAPESLASESGVDPHAEEVCVSLSEGPEVLTEVEGSAEGVTLTDNGPPPETPLPEAMQANMADVLAELLANTNQHATTLVQRAVRAAYPNNALEQVAPQLGEELVSPQEESLKTELNGVAEAAGLAEATLNQKIEERRAAVDAISNTASTELQSSNDAVCEETQARGEEEQQAIATASETAQQSIEQQQEAASGTADPAVIEAKKNRLLQKVERDVAAAYATYRRAGETRQEELTRAGNQQVAAYRLTAQRESDEIRGLYPDNVTEGRVQSRPSLDWGETQANAVQESVRVLKQQATNSTTQLQSTLNENARQARELINNWAAEKLGEERSWWQRLMDLVKSWVSQAQANNTAWEAERNQMTKDALVGDFEMLNQMRDAIATQNEDQIRAAMAGLTDEQRVVMNAFFQSGGNAITAVATGLLFRMQQRRLPDLIDTLRSKSLELEDWENLDALGRAQNPDFNAGILAREVRDAVDGCGTDEDKLFRTIGRRTPVQLAAIRKAYAYFYDGDDMDDDINSDVSGDEQDRADAALSSDATGEDIATLRNAMSGLGTDESTIMSVLRNKTPAEREALVQRYKQEYGVDLEAELKDEMSSHDLDRANALMVGDVAKADAIALDQAMNGGFLGIGTDEDQIEGVYNQVRQEVEAEAEQKGMTTAEVEAEIRRRNQQVEQSYNDTYAEGRADGLRNEFRDELSDGELDLAMGLADNDRTAIDAAKIRIEAQSFVTDDDAVNAVLRSQYDRAATEIRRDLMVDFNERAAREGWTPEQRRQELQKVNQEVEKLAAVQSKQNMANLENRYNDQYSVWGVGTLQSVVTGGMSGTDQEMARALIAQGGKLTDAQEIDFAVRGLGTDEDALKRTLKGKSPAEVARIRREYQELTGREMDADVLGDVSGRDELDFGLMLEGEPQTPAERLAQLKRKQAYETGIGSGLGSLFAGEEARILEDTVRESEDAFDAYQQALEQYGPNDPRTKELEARFNRWAGYGDYDVNAHREAVDSVTDKIATGAAIVASIAVVVASGGAATPAIAAAIAAKAAAAATAAQILTKTIVKGHAYGMEELGTDVAVGAVDVAAAYLTAGLGNALLRSQGGLLARMAQGGTLSRMAAQGGAEGMENLLGSLPSGLASSLLNDETWKSGNALEAVLLSTAMQGGVSLGMGTVMGSLGGIKAPSVEVPTSALPNVDAPSPHAGTDLPTSALPNADVPTTPHSSPHANADLPPTGAEIDAPSTGRPDVSGDTPNTDLDTPNPARSPSTPDPEIDVPPTATAATQAKLTEALPSDLQGRIPVEVDPNLNGNTVRVHYDVDADGLITNIHIRAGLAATPLDIQLHVGTIRTMQRYMGFGGRVRNLLNRIRGWITKNGDPPVGSRAWEAKLEIEKLPHIIEARMDQLAKGGLDVDAEAALRAEIESLQAQLAKYQKTLDEMDLDPGKGFVAAESITKPENWKDLGMGDRVAQILGRTDLDPAFVKQIGETLHALDEARKSGKLNIEQNQSAFTDLVSSLGSSDPKKVSEAFAELEHATNVLKRGDIDPNAPVVIGAEHNQQLKGLPEIDVPKVEADTYYKTTDGVLHIDEVKDTPNAFVSKLEENQFDRYSEWLNKGVDTSGNQQRMVDVVIRNTGPGFDQILDKGRFARLSGTIVKDKSRPFMKVGSHIFSLNDLEEMYDDAIKKLGEIHADNKAKGINIPFKDLAKQYFGSVEKTFETLGKTYGS
jgi:hypothetical protein